ncbi:MAG: hypothetical protein BalsKO_07640 [Balneolaceae bacterium]
MGDIINISYSDYSVVPTRNFAQSEMRVMDTSSTMMDFAQTVSVTANISIEFAISN